MATSDAARLSLAAFGLFAHDAREDGGFISRAERKRFFAAALFKPQADEAGRVQGDDNAAVFGAVAIEFFAAAPYWFFK